MPTTYDGIIHDEGGAVFNVRNPTYWTAQSGDIAGDDAIKIQRAINAASAAGGGTVFIPQGTYTSKSVIRVRSKVTLAGAGAGTIIRRDSGFGGSGATAFLVFVEGSAETAGYATGITIRDLALDGNKGSANTLDQQYGGSSLLYVSTAERCTVENVWAYNGLYNGIILEYCKDSVVQGCKATSNLKCGIYLSGCNRVTVANNATGGNNYPAAALAAAWFCTVTGNVFRAGGSDPNLTIPHAGLMLSRDSEYCTITGNYCQGIDTTAEPVLSSSVVTGVPTWITDERPNHPTYDSTVLGEGTLYGVYNSVIADNVLTGHTTGIRLGLSDRNRVEGNHIVANSEYGVQLYGCSRTVLSGNTIADNGPTSSSHYSVLVGRMVYNELHGTTTVSKTAPADDNLIEANDIRDDRSSPTTYGVWLQGTCLRTLVRNNRFAVANPITADGPSGSDPGSAASLKKYGNFFASTQTADGGITP